ncbi:universal stress protein [Glutamicibacter sp. NPDC087344]|uniref:universal stress protein n=1 Tax=Glutamicibacter sp. NPDC087344 TaxID=3363994 RepID=UPI00382DD659
MTILVGYTHTPQGTAALRHARTTAALLNEPMAIFPLFTPDESQPWPDPELELTAEPGTRLLEPTAESVRPAEDLLDYSNQLPATMIVIGVRARSRVGKILMGSDAQNIILSATVPVLSVKADNDEE